MELAQNACSASTTLACLPAGSASTAMAAWDALLRCVCEMLIFRLDEQFELSTALVL